MEKSSPEGFTGRPGSLLCIYSKKRHLSPGEDGASVCAKEPDFCELLTDKKLQENSEHRSSPGKIRIQRYARGILAQQGLLLVSPSVPREPKESVCPQDTLGPRTPERPAGMSKYKGGLPAAHSPFTCRLLWVALWHDPERTIETSQAPSDAGLWFSKSLERGF